MSIGKRLIWLWVIGLAAFISISTGCQTIWNNSESRKVLTNYLLFINKQDSLHIKWEAKHMTVEFKGNVDQSRLTMKGQIELSGGGIQDFPVLDRLNVDIYLTDSDGKVLDRKKFYSALNRLVDDRPSLAFERSYKLPKGTTHIAFGYEGKVREGKFGLLSTQYPFRHSPFR